MAGGALEIPSLRVPPPAAASPGERVCGAGVLLRARPMRALSVSLHMCSPIAAASLLTLHGHAPPGKQGEVGPVWGEVSAGAAHTLPKPR